MGTRIITGIVALCMVAFFLTFRGWAADLMLIAFLLVAQWEVLTCLLYTSLCQPALAGRYADQL